MASVAVIIMAGMAVVVAMIMAVVMCVVVRAAHFSIFTFYFLRF